MLSKKHHIKIAGILKKARERVSDTTPELAYKTINNIAYDLIDYFAKDNSNFNENEFYKKIRGK